MTVRCRSQDDFTLTGDGGGETPQRSLPEYFIQGFYLGSIAAKFTQMPPFR